MRKRERAAFYRKMLDTLDQGVSHPSGFCALIGRTEEEIHAWSVPDSGRIFLKDLPELLQFRPRRIRRIGLHWYKPYSWRVRRKILLKAIALAEGKPKARRA